MTNRVKNFKNLRFIVGMGIGQVSHCQAQPVGLKQGASDG